MTEPAPSAPRSLRQRLLIRLLPALLALFAVSGTLSYWGADFHANEVHDRWLVDTAEALAQQVTFARGQPAVDLPEAARKILQWDSADTTWFQVRGEQSGHLAGHPGVPDPAPGAPPERLRQATLYDGWLAGATVRVASVTVTGAGEAVEVRVAETLRKRQALAAELLLSVLLPQLVLVVVAGGVIWLALDAMLAPIGAVAQALGAQTDSSLAPVDDRALPTELMPLTRAMNALLLRLRDALAAQRHFIADAAHQLRTPLTALKLHADEAARETDPKRLALVLAELQRAADRAVRLSQQLLTLARAEPSARVNEPVRLDLRQPVMDAVAASLPRAVSIGSDLGLIGGPLDPGPPIEVLGDPDLLAEAVNNLVDNALRYAGRGARITVGLETVGEQVRLTVDDDGPGIAPADRERVLQRFHRGARGTGDTADLSGLPAGTGLGLAIVAEIARGHQGRVWIETVPSGRGARVVIELPCAPQAHITAPRYQGTNSS